jgi:uncharacterized protein (DUF58 family)
MHQRITLAGVVYSLATAIVGSVAFLTANNLLFLVLAAMLGTLMVAGFVSRLSLAGLQLDLELPPHPTARSRNTARLALKNEKSIMASYSILVTGAKNSAYASHVYFPLIPPGKSVETTVEVTFARRGLHTENSFQLESRFPLGLTRRNVDLTLRREVIVYPSLDPQPDIAALGKDVAGEIEAVLRGQGHDFYRIRPYQSNESARHVDWRATAHTGALQVREFAREQEPLVEIYLDINVPAAIQGDAATKDWFDHAVDGCAYLCWDLARRGSSLRLVAAGFDRLVPIDADVYTCLEFLALVSPAVRPLAASATAAPLQTDSVRVVFAAQADGARLAGWHGAHVVDLKGYTGRDVESAPASR